MPMGKVSQRNKRIIFLAYVHRYLFPVLIVLPPLAFGRQYTLLAMGIGCILFAAYTLIGYLLHWKHLFCSYQNACHKQMTPDRINWNQTKKADAYGMPVIFGVMGLAMLLCHIFCA